jgi:hypothetical protein
MTKKPTRDPRVKPALLHKINKLEVMNTKLE